jgi:hypothetical protein
MGACDEIVPAAGALRMIFMTHKEKKTTFFTHEDRMGSPHTDRLNHLSAPLTGRIAWWPTTAAAVALLLLMAPTGVNAGLVALGPAGSYGVFGTTVSFGGGVDVTGSVGIGQGGSLSTSGTTQTITGTIDLGPGATTNFSNGFTHSTTSNPNLNTAAITSLQNAQTSYDAMTSTVGGAGGTTNGAGGGSGTITAGSSVPNNINVVDLSQINGAITLSGNASSIFIINVSNNVDFGGASGVTLAGGVTANHVLFNVSGEVTLGGNNTVSGTFLDPNGTINVGGASNITGDLLGGSNSFADSIQTNTHITEADFVQPAAVPEPSSIVLAVSGLIVIGVARVCSRRRTA